MDGEGCISIVRVRPKSGVVYYAIDVTIGMTRKALPALHWMAARWGGAPRKQRDRTEKWDEAWRWVIGAGRAESFLRDVLPFLLIKKEHARLALRFQALPSPRKGPDHEAAYRKMRELNRKGWSPTAPSIPEGAIAFYAEGSFWLPQMSLLTPTGFEPFSGDLPRSGSLRNGVISARPTWEPRTEGSGSSSWPTLCTAPEAPNRGSNAVNVPTSLGDAAMGFWQTPVTFQGKYRRQQRQTTREEELLPAQAESVTESAWPTPCAGTKGPGGEGRRDGGPTLQTVAATAWPTPNAADGRLSPDYPHKGGNPTLPMLADRFPSGPPAQTTETDGPASSQSDPTSRRLWPSAQASDWKDKSCSRDTALTNRKVMPTFAQQTTTKRLNPRFVEWLMGLPAGWTNCAPSATALSPWLRRWRSEFCRIVSGGDA